MPVAIFVSPLHFKNCALSMLSLADAARARKYRDDQYLRAWPGAIADHRHRSKVRHLVHSVLLCESSQVENFFEFFVIARVVLRETNVADVQLDASFLELVRLDSFTRGAAPETTKNFLSFFGKRKIDE